MGQGEVNYSRRRGFRNLPVMFAALLLALLLHALPLLFSRPSESKESTEAKAEQRFTRMVSKLDGAKDEYGLEYWLYYGNPHDFSDPDSRYGFSGLLRATGTPAMRLIPVPPSAVSLTKDLAAPQNSRIVRVRAPEELFVRLTPHYAAYSRTPKKTAAVPKRPYWIAADGAELGNIPFSMTPELRKLIQNAASLTGTELQVLPSAEPETPPLIRVEKSCGDRRLDLAAVNALAVYAGAGLTPEQLERLKFVVVDWRAPKTGKMRRRHDAALAWRLVHTSSSAFCPADCLRLVQRRAEASFE